MKKIRSVSIILSVCTGLLVLMLVTLFTVAAKQHFDSREAASHRLSIATVAQQLVAADEDLRDERGAVDAVRHSADPVGASDRDRIANFRGRSKTALATLNVLLKTENGVLSAPERQRLARLQSRYETGYAGMSDMLRLPARDRSKAIVAEWIASTNEMITTFENEIIAHAILNIMTMCAYCQQCGKPGKLSF